MRFEKPEHIPMAFHINAACWKRYGREALRELMAGHPFLFPDFQESSEDITPQYASVARAGEPYTDDWGCVWETTENGITGRVTGHPLADWKAFEEYQPPDPAACCGIGPLDWDKEGKRLREDREEGRLAAGGLRHGHTFLQLCDIRGYENFLFDMMNEDPRVRRLIRMVEGFNLEIVLRYIERGAEWMGYPDDLGMQVGPMVPPRLFQEYVKPSYQRLMAPAREAGCVIHMHSDGDIRLLADDLVDGGVEVLNLQDLVNGIDWIAGRFAGRVCVELDVDRQKVTRFGSPRDIDVLIREEVEKLGRKEGGLMMIYGLYPGVPLENAAALMDAMERYASFYG